MDKRALRIAQKDEEYIKHLFNNAAIVFDTSALLDMYSYPFETRQTLFSEIFKKAKLRLWLPGHVEFEYLKNKDKVIKKPINDYNNLIDKVQNYRDGGYISKMLTVAEEIQSQKIKNISGLLKTLEEITKTSEKHPHLSSDLFSDINKSVGQYIKQSSKFIDNVKEFKDKFKSEVNEKINSVMSTANSDDVLKFVLNNFTIGPKYPFKRLINLYKNGQMRYEMQIPPGYLDNDKNGIDKYGDFILWSQILEYAKDNSKSIIFVTNDTKGDWWNNIEGVFVPRLELIKEFVDHTAQDFWMFTANEFYHEAKKHLQLNIDDQLLEQLPEVELNPILKMLEGREKSFTMWLQYNTMLTNLKVDDTYFEQSFDITAYDRRGHKVLIIAKFARTYRERALVSDINSSENIYNSLKNRIAERTNLMLAYTYSNFDQAEEAKQLTIQLLTDDHTILAKEDLIGYILIGYMNDEEYVFHYSDFPNLTK